MMFDVDVALQVAMQHYPERLQNTLSIHQIYGEWENLLLF